MTKKIKRPGTKRNPETVTQITFQRPIAAPEISDQPIVAKLQVSTDPELDSRTRLQDYTLALRVSREISEAVNSADRHFLYYRELGYSTEEALQKAYIAYNPQDEALQLDAIMVSMLDDLFVITETTNGIEISLRDGVEEIEVDESYWDKTVENRRRNMMGLPKIKLDQRNIVERKVAMIKFLMQASVSFSQGVSQAIYDAARIGMSLRDGGQQQTDSAGFQSGGLDQDAQPEHVALDQKA